MPRTLSDPGWGDALYLYFGGPEIRYYSLLAISGQ